MNFKDLFHSTLNHIRDSLESQAFLDQYKEPKRFVRKRLLSMYQVIMYLIYSNKAAMATNIGNIRDDLWSLDFPAISRQALSKARQYILPELFEELYKITVRDYYDAGIDYKLWHGYHLFAIDGSQIHMTNNKSVIEKFGECGDPRYNRHHYMGLASCLYDVSQDIIVDASLSHCKTSERALAMKHLEKLQQFSFAENALVVFDRGYYSYKLFNHLTDSGIKCLMRIKSNCKSLTSSDKDDTLMDLKKIHGQIRVIRIPLSSGETEYLVTNILDNTITPEMFKDLYHGRWNIELKFFELKDQWGLEHFNGATSRAVCQEFYITLMKSNLVSLIKRDVDEEIAFTNASSSDSSEKKLYQACRSFIIGRLSKLLPRYILRERVNTTYKMLFTEARRILSLVRLDRHAKREKPIRHKINSKNRKTTT